MLAQIFEITMMNIRNIGSRLGSSSVIVVGIAGVVAVLVGLLSMAAGFTSVLESTSLENRAIVMRDGSNNEMSSGLAIDEFNVISRLEGIELASAEIYLVADVPKKGTGTPSNVIIRGMRQAGFEVCLRLVGRGSDESTFVRRTRR